MDQARILRIVVASPGDVQGERDLLPQVIDELNRGMAAERGLRLELSRWETDAHPGFHPEGPQGLIDPILKIPTDCDLLIGIFWTRFGTPTPDGTTGTEHEIRLACEAWKEKGSPQIFVYFNDKPPRSRDAINPEQLGKVQEFRRNFPKEGLSWPYKGKAQFKDLVRNHLTNYIRNLPKPKELPMTDKAAPSISNSITNSPIVNSPGSVQAPGGTVNYYQGPKRWTLSSQQQAQFLALLQQGAKGTIEISCISSDAESCDIAKQIQDVLRSGGPEEWKRPASARSRHRAGGSRGMFFPRL